MAIALALGTGVAIGLLQGFFVARLGVPSFVVTLAGLLGWNGVLLQIIGSSGTIVIQNSFINGIANEYMSAALSWIVAILLVAAYAFQGLSNVYRRRQAGLPNDPWAFVIGRIVILAIAAIAVVVIANSDRGLPYVTLIMLGSYVIWTFVAERTRFGRHIYAVGGNAEAARRAGINVPEHQDRRVRDLGLHGGARRNRARLAAELGRHLDRRRHDPALLDRRRGDRRHQPVRRSRNDQERVPRRDRDRR